MVTPTRVETTGDADPVAFLSLVGHRLRWRLLRELADGDRTVNELCGRVGEAQNLVSYHLGKLRRAGLATSKRSSADGRDTYYSLDLARLDASLTSTAGSLHPGLTARPGASASPGGASVLFLCTGNSARSQIAEALVEARSGGAVAGRSAGSNPKPLHPNAVRVMTEEFGLDISKKRSKHVDEFVDRRFDRVITLCDRVREVCPQFPGVDEPEHWSVADPGHGQSDDNRSYPAFRRTAALLDTRIRYLLASLSIDRQPNPQGET